MHALGVRRLVRGYQVHGTVVGRLTERDAPALEGRPPVDRTSHGEHAHHRSEGPLERGPSAEDDLRPALRADGHAVPPGDLPRWCSPPTVSRSRSAPRSAVAMLHAGWRGLAAGVLEEGVRALRELGGARRCRGRGRTRARAPAAMRSARRSTRRSRSPRSRSPDRPARIARERLLAAGVAEVRDWRRARSVTSASSPTVAKALAPGVKRGWRG